MREWIVAGALIEAPGGLLLVRNQRPGGSFDWSPPGGVIDASDESLLAGLEREVEEETGLRVDEWEGPLYEVRAVAVDLGWVLRAEVWRALSYVGELRVSDPDGIVVEAAFIGDDERHERLTSGFPWVWEPITEWLVERWGPDDARGYHYHVHGTEREAFEVRRAHPESKWA